MDRNIRTKRTLRSLAAAVLVLLSGVSAGISFAYLQAQTEMLKNVITVGTIEIELTEDRWNPDYYQAVVPGQVIEKNPAVVNCGKNAAHVFMELHVPIRSFSAVTENGHKALKEEQEVITFAADTKNWELLDQHRESSDMVYVYGYSRILYPGEQTEELFSQVRMADYLEGDLDWQDKLSIDVQAKAIQTEVDTVGGSMKEIYDRLLVQTAKEKTAVQRLTEHTGEEESHD